MRGFSLVELSIVLVILGLLTGGILGGQALIRAAELRAVSTEFNRYVTAVQTFRDKYFAIPGDMTNATAFWKSADGSTGTTAACKTIAATDTATCNGDGNGQLQALSYTVESFRFWHHLANAGMIEGTYSGITDGTNDASATTRNSPRGKITNSLWYAGYLAPVTSGTSFFNGTYENYFQFGLPAVSNGLPWTGFASPEEAWNIDTKMDDGKPGQGKLFARDPGGMTGTNCTTATGGAQTNADYYLVNMSKNCSFMFRQAF
jgi:prepilin-type N-terminal cleavage/methylation domain-containing protein